MDSNESGSGDVRDKLMEDLRLVIRDAEDLLRGTRQYADEGYQKARARFESTLSSAKGSFSSVEEQVMSNAQEAFETTDEYVKTHPWQAVGGGALVGLMIGLWLSRR